MENKTLLTKNNAEVADDLLTFTKEFYRLNPEFKNTSLHIYAESYGGKMAPEFAYVLHKAIQNGDIDVKLESVGIVAPWVSPIDSVLSWPGFLLNMGFIDTKGYNEVHSAALKTEQILNAELFEEATWQWGQTENVIVEQTLGIDFYNVLFKQNFKSTQSRLAMFAKDVRRKKYV